MHRIGLIGFGSIAEHAHLPALLRLSGVEIVAVADLSAARLDRARSLLPAAALYDSPLELIRRADLTGVDICTPPRDHADLILAACRQGLRDIVCEKPLVLDEDEYLRVARARARSGSRIASVNNWMHSDLNRHVSGALLERAIGVVRSVELRTGRPDCALGNDGWNPRWRTDVMQAGGGIILDHGWHQLYLLLGWTRAPVQSVSAVARSVHPRHHPVEDEACLELRFPAACGRITLSWTAAGRTNGGIVRGTDGTIVIHDDRIVVDNKRGLQHLPFQGKLSLSSYHPDWFEAMFTHTLLDECGEEANRSFAEAGVLVSIIAAAYRSTRASGVPCGPTFADSEMTRAVVAEKAALLHGF